jgi:hypothetical protein
LASKVRASRAPMKPLPPVMRMFMGWTAGVTPTS